MKNKIMKRTSVIVAIALAFGALDGTASAATLYAVTGTNTLLQFDSATPATITRTVAITGLLTGSERVLGIDFRPRTGQLFAVTIPTGVPANGLLTAYRVNPHSGVATFVGSIPPNTVPGAADVASGFDFNPTVDRIRIVNVNDENFRVNPNNGALSGNDTNLNPSGRQVIAESYDRNWNRAFATTVATTLYGISRTAPSSLVLQGGLNGSPSPNGGQITTVGPLGVTLDAFSDAGFDIDAGGTAYAALTVGGLTRLYSVNLTTGAATLVGTIGTGTTAVTGLAVVPRSLVVVGAGEGGNPRVRVFDAATGAQLPGALGSFFAFTPGFRGGVNVAAGDVNGDGYEDVIVAAGRGSPHVRVFSGLNGAELLHFVAYDPVFQGGVRVAAADFNLDGLAEIITAAGPGGRPRVRIFDGTGNPFVGDISNNFLAFAPSFAGGVFVAAGDIDGDGVPDVVAGADADASFGPQVKAISGKTGAVILSFFAYSASFRGGVRVAAADVTGDGIADVITAAGPAPGSQPLVRSFSIDEQPSGPLANFHPYPATFRGGVYVGATRR